MPTDEPGGVADLIRDARLMIAYATRAGKLRDEAIVQIVNEVEADIEAHGPLPMALKKLSGAVSTLAQSIAPVTAMDLGSSWRPFPHQRHDALSRGSFALAAALVAVTLSFLTSFYTATRNTADDLAAISAEDFTSKASHLYAHWLRVRGHFSHVYDKSDVDVDDFFHDYDEVRTLQDKLIANRNSAERVLSHAPDMRFISIPIYRVTNSLSCLARNDRKCPATSSNSGNLKEMSALSGAELRSAVDPSATPQVQTDDEPYKYYYGMNKYLNTIGITVSSNADSNGHSAFIADKIDECRQIIAFYGVWLLPAIYGLLGGMVYQLRNFMNPLMPIPNFSYVVVRLALATMAGVSASWVQGSMGAKEVAGAGPGLAVFGMAFIFGFGVDIFFSALDRAVGSLSKTIGGREPESRTLP
jgi:hypothetical protein